MCEELGVVVSRWHDGFNTATKGDYTCITVAGGTFKSLGDISWALAEGHAGRVLITAQYVFGGSQFGFVPLGHKSTCPHGLEVDFVMLYR